MSIKKLKRNYYIVLMVLVFIILIARLVYTLQSDMLHLDIPIDFNKGWNMESEEDQNTVFFNRKITEEMLGKVVYFYVYDSFVDARAGEKDIYHYGQTTRYLKSPGTLWHMITVPADALGEELSIRIQFAYANKYTTDFDFRLASSGAVVLSLLGNEALDLAVNLVILVLGIILCLIFLLQHINKMQNLSSLYLGLLSICFVLWTNNNLFFTQLIFPYGAGQYFAYYFFLFCLPLLMICYLESITEGLKFNYLFWSHVTLGLVITGLQFAGIAEFTETLGIFLICSGVEMVIIIARLLMNKKNQSNRRLSRAFIVMIIFILINAVMYLFNSTKGVSVTVAKVGIGFYLLVSIYDRLTGIITDLAEAKQTKALRKIAFTDSLTDVGNRYAFNFEINEMSLDELSLFSLDINNLKYYNDTFGHACGDTLIREAVRMMGQVFEHLYRTGGDEFIAIAIDKNAEELSAMKIKLDGLMKEYNQNEPDVLVEIACGYSSIQEGDISYEDILRRADREMYKDKVALKKESKIKSVR